MRVSKSAIPLLLGMAIALGAIGWSRVAAQTTPTLAVSDNIGSVPGRSDMELTQLPASVTTVQPGAAVDSAMNDWGLSAAELDQNIGVVRAVVTREDDPNHPSYQALIVVGDITTHDPAPGSNTTYAKIVIVVDAATGKVDFSYPVLGSG